MVLARNDIDGLVLPGGPLVVCSANQGTALSRQFGLLTPRHRSATQADWDGGFGNDFVQYLLANDTNPIDGWIVPGPFADPNNPWKAYRIVGRETRDGGSANGYVVDPPYPSGLGFGGTFGCVAWTFDFSNRPFVQSPEVGRIWGVQE